MTALSRNFLKSGVYLAAVVLLPGALIGAPLLWWLGHRNAKRTALQPSNRLDGIDGRCTHCG
jgi:hypothetical protein